MALILLFGAGLCFAEAGEDLSKHFYVGAFANIGVMIVFVLVAAWVHVRMKP